MPYIIALWIVWSVLALLLFSLILYHLYLIHHHAAPTVSDDSGKVPPVPDDAGRGKALRFQRIIRILGGVEGLATLAIAGYYVLDALRQI